LPVPSKKKENQTICWHVVGGAAFDLDPFKANDNASNPDGFAAH
jgi:hypothetical protein